MVDASSSQHSRATAGAFVIGPAVFAVGLMLFCGTAVWVAGGAGIPPGALLRDAADQFGIPLYANGLSFLGEVALIATAATALLTVYAVRRDRWLYLGVAALSAFMAFDDVFLFHERIGPRYFGLSSEAVPALYALATLVLIAVMHRMAIPGRWGILVPCALLGMSVGIDVFRDISGYKNISLEDIPKIGGFGAWFAFWFLIFLQAIRTRP